MARKAFVDYDPNDALYGGAAAVVDHEREAIRGRRKRAGEEVPASGPLADVTGLALSGGGIRSASFGLGVLQALARAGWLSKVDYLSTVSGGGYIGASLTWLLHRAWDAPEAGPGGAPAQVRFGVRDDNFPYGLFPVAGSTVGGASQPQSYRGRLLRYLRQNTSYLMPGQGINALSLLAAVLRSTVFSLTVYGLLLLGLFLLLGPLIYAPAFLGLSRVGVLALLPWALLLPAVFAYSVWTQGIHDRTRRQYLGRRRVDRWAAVALAAALGLAVLVALPALYGWLQSPAATPTQVYQVQAVGAVAEPWPQFVVTQGATAPGAEPQSQLQRALTAGSLSTLLGVISSLGAFLRSQGGTQRSRLPTSLLVALGTTALVFGVLLLAYTGYVFIDRHLSSPWTYGLAALACLGAALLGGLCVNTNYMSVHRYYRDRLMETFMPDVGAALPMDGVPKGLAQDADTKELHRVWPPTGRAAPGPYPLINAHVMLVSSRIPKFRGRGGDSFVFSPWYSGSNATGWARTSRSYRWMTLASAMAVSGAAVNPNTGVGGSGVTRQPMLSLLMGLLNIRLAYGVLNPMPRPQRLERMQHQGQPAWRRALLVLAERLCKDVPNAIWPGLAELLLRSDLDENSHMLQLTDGGHFENLGLYELVRRRVPLIIASDAGADPGYGFGDLANAIEKVRADFGVLIDISAADLERLTPGRVPDRDPPLTSVAERGFLVARVLYPEAAAQPMVGTLIYMTTTFFKELSADLYGYKRNCPDFPDQPTSDQFFNEQQFDAYRELGYQTAWQMLQSAEVRTLRPVLRRMGLPPWEPPGGR